MRFKIGVGLLLFAVVLSNGAAFDMGSFFYIAALVIGALGLIAVVASGNDKPKQD